MNLKVMTARRVVVDREVDKIVADGSEGSFGLLPRHIDIVTTLVPGILTYSVDAHEVYVATDEGVLVKVGDEVLVSVYDAVEGPDLEGLEATVRERYEQLDDREHALRSSLDRLQADVIRRFVEVSE